MKRSRLNRKTPLRRGTPIRKKRKSKTAETKHKCDLLFAKVIKLRDGCCLKCGAQTNLQCSHVLSRTISITRCDEDNAITLCGRCHIFGPDAWHKDPVGIARWFEERWPGRYDELRVKAQSKDKVDWIATLSSLQIRYESLRDMGR